MQEIERKYIVDKVPDNLEDYEHKEVEQFYISLNPEIRARRVDNEYYFTIKIGTGLTREEIEMSISEEVYTTLKVHALGNIINKTRYYIRLDCGLVVEVDKFNGVLAPLYLAEIEFPTESEAHLFMGLSWFGKEVTEDKAYKNQSLATSVLSVAK